MSTPEQKTCFIIRPFNTLYNGRHDNIFVPAIEGAGLSVHLAGGPGVNEITKEIEDGIRDAHVCFADVSENNPNVWYEVGFAFAYGKKVAMVCNTDMRELDTLPFDVKTKKVIPYRESVDSNVQDAAQLQREITKHIKKLPKATLPSAKTNPPPAPEPPAEDNESIILDGLTRGDLDILYEILTNHSEDGESLSVSSLKSRHNSLDVDASIPILIEKGYVVSEYILFEDEYKSTGKALELYRKHKYFFGQ